MHQISFFIILILSMSPRALAETQNTQCTSCHKNYNMARGTQGPFPLLKEHQNIVNHHLVNKKNCLLCHSRTSPNDLVLLNGTVIPVSQSPKLCGQCHGPIFSDWSQGIHGKVVGAGTPEMRKFFCVECHNPHEPKFKKMKADPPPHHPKLLWESDKNGK